MSMILFRWCAFAFLMLVILRLHLIISLFKHGIIEVRWILYQVQSRSMFLAIAFLWSYLMYNSTVVVSMFNPATTTVLILNFSFFVCRGSFMRICRRSFSLISFRRQIKSSSTGQVGFIDMTNLCTFPIHVSSFNLRIFLRGAVLTVQQLRQCFRHHFRVPISTESTIVRLRYLGSMTKC